MANDLGSDMVTTASHHGNDFARAGFVLSALFRSNILSVQKGKYRKINRKSVTAVSYGRLKEALLAQLVFVA